MGGEVVVHFEGGALGVEDLWVGSEVLVFVWRWEGAEGRRGCTVVLAAAIVVVFEGCLGELRCLVCESREE